MARIALFQSTTGIDPDANGASLKSAIAEAAARGSEILFTPEMSGMLDRDSARAAAKLQRQDQDCVLATCRDAAREHGIWVHLGSLAIRAEDGKVANRALVIDSEGHIRAHYDKIHLFDVDLPTGESWRESAVYRAGDRSVAVDGTPIGRLGLTICYDLRFPELFARLAQAECSAIAVPAAFTVPTGRAHWQVLLRARAIEAGLFVVAAAQTGRHEDGRETYGHSMVVGPWGDVLLDMGTEPGIGVVDVNLAEIETVRSRLPVIAHRRPVDSPEIR